MSGATRRLANKQANKSILSRDLGGRACGGSAHDEERSCEGGRAFDFERFGAKGWAKAGHAAQASPNLANRYLSEFVVSGTVVGKQCPRRRSPATPHDTKRIRTARVGSTRRHTQD